MKGIAILALAAAAASAQDTAYFRVASDQFEYEGKVVPGAPYTAQAVTETTQVLPDGNRITRKSSSNIARDSQGRTRREQSLDAVGPWAAPGNEPPIVFINDPVAGVRYTLESNSHTAVKMTMSPVDVQARQDLEAKLKAARRKAEAEFGNTRSVSSDFHYNVRTQSPDGPAGGSVIVSRVSSEPRNPPKTESLGTQVIEGVPADGKRITETIPAGRIGNERPIDVINETWYSSDLQTVVMSKHSDPRTGDVVYTLTNISRAEPDPALFSVPPITK